MPAPKSRKARTPRSGMAGKSISPNSEAAALYLSNQESSRLLKLPRELRSIIYSYVLGGNRTIFVDYKHHTWKRPEFGSPARWALDVKGGFCCTVWPCDVNPYNGKWMDQRKHRAPNKESSGFTLLNQVCRQLYVETDTVAMAENIWAFTSPKVMNRFLLQEKRFSLVQRRAVKTILIYSPFMLSKSVVKYLGNLETVLVHGRPVYEVNPKRILPKEPQIDRDEDGSILES